jgi:hypothetical protein
MRGKAHCIYKLGEIALRRSEHAAARVRFEEALTSYQRIAEPYTVGLIHRQLARLASDTEERKSHVISASIAWKHIKRQDLVSQLQSEFDNVLLEGNR